MLFKLATNTPRFEAFRLLNQELIFFLKESIDAGHFRRELFTPGTIGQTCWDNSKANNTKAKKDLTRDKFEKLFNELQKQPQKTRQQLLDIATNNQDLEAFFKNPNRNLFNFLPTPCFESLKEITTHLYCATKDLQGIVDASGNIDIKAHFESFRADGVNGNICKACGMGELAAFRASVPEGEQWRADFDHQLCKSKYPLFAVHPDNLIPLCSVCNQDAKKAKDLFIRENDQPRNTFYPYTESALPFVEIDLDMLRDPEPKITVTWTTHDAAVLEKLDTWDDVYEIKNRVEGRFRNLEKIIRNEINPNDYAHFDQQIIDKARPVPDDVLRDKEWAFWYQKLFYKLSQIDKAPFWEKSRFSDQQGDEGAAYILEGT
ncbi:hypothetical protein ABZQ71_06820 [Pseudomonas aeruginosa]|uniref:hypothetical protein n=1 Tax=Pseudomonas aeruginosa TaxID=287 RepID=UPI00345AA2D2